MSKNDFKNYQKRDPKTEVKIEIFWPKLATGVLHKLAPLSLGGALPASWVIFAPKMAQEPHFDPNLRQIYALSLPKSHILTPTCTKFAPKLTHNVTLKDSL